MNRDGARDNIMMAKQNAENEKHRRQLEDQENRKKEAAKDITTGMSAFKVLEKKQNQALEITSGLIDDLEQNSRQANISSRKRKCCTII